MLWGAGAAGLEEEQGQSAFLSVAVAAAQAARLFGAEAAPWHPDGNGWLLSPAASKALAQASSSSSSASPPAAKATADQGEEEEEEEEASTVTLASSSWTRAVARSLAEAAARAAAAAPARGAAAKWMSSAAAVEVLGLVASAPLATGGVFLTDSPAQFVGVHARVAGTAGVDGLQPPPLLLPSWAQVSGADDAGACSHLLVPLSPSSSSSSSSSSGEAASGPLLSGDHGNNNNNRTAWNGALGRRGEVGVQQLLLELRTARQVSDDGAAAAAGVLSATVRTTAAADDGGNDAPPFPRPELCASLLMASACLQQLVGCADDLRLANISASRSWSSSSASAAAAAAAAGDDQDVVGPSSERYITWAPAQKKEKWPRLLQGSVTEAPYAAVTGGALPPGGVCGAGFYRDGATCRWCTDGYVRAISHCASR